MAFFNKPIMTNSHWTSEAGGHDIIEHLPTMDAVFAIEANIISKSIQSDIFSYVIAGKSYYIKRYYRSVGFASWLGLSRLNTEIKNQLWFNQSKLPSARVVAHGQERLIFKARRGVLITEAIEGSVDLAHIAKEQPHKFQDPIWVKTLAEQLANILSYFHTHRFCHNDLHWRNILVGENTEAHHVQAYLIDCPFGKRLFWPFLEYKKCKDLANLDKFAPQHLSRSQRLRFFFQYRNISKLDAENKALIRKIMQHKANRIKRKAKQK